MIIDILTLFPSFFTSSISIGVINGALEMEKITLNIADIRLYGDGNYKKCDDYSYGGGPGMVMKASIFKKYFDSNKKGYTLLFSPSGTSLTQQKIKEFAQKEHITCILGHYEGVDARVEKLYADETISIGDYVLSGGEIASLVLIDSIARYKGVLGNDKSVINDTFEEESKGLLEYEQYTRPLTIGNISVPSTLLRGNHKDIEKYRREMSVIRTFKYRPDLLSNAELTKEDIKSIYKYLLNVTYSKTYI